MALPSNVGRNIVTMVSALGSHDAVVSADNAGAIGTMFFNAGS